MITLMICKCGKMLTQEDLDLLEGRPQPQIPGKRMITKYTCPKCSQDLNVPGAWPERYKERFMAEINWGPVEFVMKDGQLIMQVVGKGCAYKAEELDQSVRRIAAVLAEAKDFFGLD